MLCPAKATLLGPAATIPQEYPGVTCQASTSPCRRPGEPPGAGADRLACWRSSPPRPPSPSSPTAAPAAGCAASSRCASDPPAADAAPPLRPAGRLPGHRRPRRAWGSRSPAPGARGAGAAGPDRPHAAAAARGVGGARGGGRRRSPASSAACWSSRRPAPRCWRWRPTSPTPRRCGRVLAQARQRFGPLHGVDPRRGSRRRRPAAAADPAGGRRGARPQGATAPRCSPSCWRRRTSTSSSSARRSTPSSADPGRPTTRRPTPSWTPSPSRCAAWADRRPSPSTGTPGARWGWRRRPKRSAPSAIRCCASGGRARRGRCSSPGCGPSRPGCSTSTAWAAIRWCPARSTWRWRRRPSASCAGGAAPELRDVLFVSPLAVGDGDEREVRAVLRRAGRRLPLLGAQPRRRRDGRSTPSDRSPRRSRRPETFDLPALLGGCGSEQAMGEAYRDDLRQAGLGPRWESLRKVHVGTGEVVGLIELAPELAGDVEELELHPALLDVATCFAEAYVPRQEGYYLPLSYQRLTVRGPLPARFYSHARFKTNGHGVRRDARLRRRPPGRNGGRAGPHRGVHAQADRRRRHDPRAVASGPWRRAGRRRRGGDAARRGDRGPAPPPGAQAPAPDRGFDPPPAGAAGAGALAHRGGGGAGDGRAGRRVCPARARHSLSSPHAASWRPARRPLAGGARPRPGGGFRRLLRARRPLAARHPARLPRAGGAAGGDPARQALRGADRGRLRGGRRGRQRCRGTAGWRGRRRPASPG